MIFRARLPSTSTLLFKISKQSLGFKSLKKSQIQLATLSSFSDLSNDWVKRHSSIFSPLLSNRDAHFCVHKILSVSEQEGFYQSGFDCQCSIYNITPDISRYLIKNGSAAAQIKNISINYPQMTLLPRLLVPVNTAVLQVRENKN